MRALVKSCPGAAGVSVVDVAIPVPSEGEALVRIRRSGLCGTDLLVCDDLYRGRNRPVPLPLTLGHEAAGEVMALGPGTNGPHPGSRVSIEAVSGCGACFHCLRGRYNLCPDWDHLGLTSAGALAEFAVVRAASLIPLPASVSFDGAAILEPLATVAHTLERARPLPGISAAIIGPGPLGLLHVLALRAANAGPIVVLGRPGDERRLEIARRAGADHACVADRQEANALVNELTDGTGVGLAIETAGTGEAVQTALDIVAGSGTLATLGLARNVELDALQVMRKNLTWIGVVAAVRRHWAQAIEWVASGLVAPDALITHALPLDDALEGLAVLRSRAAVKVMFAPAAD